jgi:hypothetical protein
MIGVVSVAIRVTFRVFPFLMLFGAAGGMRKMRERREAATAIKVARRVETLILERREIRNRKMPDHKANSFSSAEAHK